MIEKGNKKDMTTVSPLFCSRDSHIRTHKEKTLFEDFKPSFCTLPVLCQVEGPVVLSRGTGISGSHVRDEGFYFDPLEFYSVEEIFVNVEISRICQL